MQMIMWIEHSVYLKWHLQVISGGIASSWSDKLENFHPDKQCEYPFQIDAGLPVVPDKQDVP